MRVAFDISEPASLHGTSGGKRGVSRVVDNLLDGLRREPGVDLVLTAAYAVHGGRQLHAADPALAVYPFRYSRAQSAMGRLNDSLRGYVEQTLARRAPWRRVLRAGITRAVGRLRYYEARLPATLLADCDIFHSLYDAIPETLRKDSRLKKFLTVYDLIPILYPSMADATFLRRALASVGPDDRVLCISQAVRDDVCAYLGHDPALVSVTPLAAARETFYPCADADRIARVRAGCGIPPGQRYLLTLCAMEPRKNLPHLVRCFLRLAAAGEIPDLCLVLVGKQTGAAAAELERQFGTDPLYRSRVIATGYVIDGDLAALYSGAMTFVFPSLAEGFGLPPLEAMQCGVPVITSNATSLPEVVGDASILLDPTDGDALCQSILQLSRDEGLRADLSARGIRRAAEFTWERCVRGTVAAYRAALAGQPADRDSQG